MSKILKNTTGSIVFIADVGQSVPASGQLTISASDYDKYAQSSDVLVYIGNGTLVVNDGSFDLTLSDGVDLIKGNFPQSLIVKGQLDDTSPSTPAENDYTSVRITPARGLHTNLRDQAGTEIATASNPVRTDPTGTTTQPISAASLPLPSGAATAANQTTEIASLSSIDTKLSSQATATNQSTMIASLQLIDDIPAGMNAAFNKAAPIAGQLDDTSTTIATEDNVAPVRITPQRAVHVNLRNQAGSEIGTALNPVRIDPTGSTIQGVSGSLSTAVDLYSSYSPDFASYLEVVGGSTPAVDPSQNTMIRGQVLTDEGSFRDDFPGSGLTTALTGTLSFVNGSPIVTGVGTLFTTELQANQYLKKTADANSLYRYVSYVVDDTTLVLDAAYTGTTASSTGIKANFKPSITGGASISVASSILSLISSTANGNAASIVKITDYMPCNLVMYCNVTQRIANQSIVFGLQDDPSSPVQQAVFVLDGATNTTIKVRTSFSAAASDTQETTVTLASGLTTAQYLLYQIDVTSNQVAFLINEIVVAIHKLHLPSPYTVLHAMASITNSAVVTTTTLLIDFCYFSNTNQVQISNDFTGEPLKAQLMGKSVTTGLPVDLALDSNGNLIVTALTGFNSDFSFGDVTLAAIALAVVRRTAYTEQSSNAQRSIVSANANDTAAGTGARTVQITYYTATFTGPFTETLTMNGTTPVNTVATNICYIEAMNVLTAGSGGVNAGIISLKAATAGGGATIGTIAASDNQTFWAHHYIPSGKVCNITGVSCNHNGTTVGSGGLFIIKALSLGVANAIENQVTDFIRLYGQSSTATRTYTSPVKVNGPARLIVYVTPETASSTVYRAAVDFFEP